MGEQPLGMAVQVEVGPVGEVQAERLDQPDQRQLVAEEVAGALLGGIGPVEGHHPRAGGRGPVGADVQAASAPAVVGLPGRDRVLHHQGGLAGVVADGQGHVALAGGRDQLEQVVAGRPGRADGQSERRPPVGLDHVGPRDPGGGGLAAARQRPRPPDQAPAPTLIPAHPVGPDSEPAGRGGDVQPHPLASGRAHVVGPSLGRVGGALTSDPPAGRPRTAVLDGDRVPGRTSRHSRRRDGAGAHRRRRRPAGRAVVRPKNEHDPGHHEHGQGGGDCGCGQAADGHHALQYLPSARMHSTRAEPTAGAPQPRPMKGILVAMMVMVATLASRGRSAM